MQQLARFCVTGDQLVYFARDPVKAMILCHGFAELVDQQRPNQGAFDLFLAERFAGRQRGDPLDEAALIALA